MKTKKVNQFDIINKFKTNGIVVLKKFLNNTDDFFKLTNKFTLKYSNDSKRRVAKHSSGKIKTVDIGNSSIPLHSESSFTTTWPVIIWFYCKKISNQSASTNYSDGIEIWKNLCTDTKKFFLSKPLVFQNKIDIEITTNAKGIKDWYMDYVGVKNCKLDYNQKKLCFDFIKFAVQKDNYTDKLCFANHILSAYEKDEPQIKKISTIDNRPIPTKIIEEIKKISKKNTIKHSWDEGDVIMLNNHRFMHGRDKIKQNDKREIFNAQSLIVNF